MICAFVAGKESADGNRAERQWRDCCRLKRELGYLWGQVMLSDGTLGDCKLGESASFRDIRIFKRLRQLATASSPISHLEFSTQAMLNVGIDMGMKQYAIS